MIKKSTVACDSKMERSILLSHATVLFIIFYLLTKRRPLYLKTQSVPHTKHFSS
jgi:hypothetical protein